mgnify:CR=1 FL=1
MLNDPPLNHSGDALDSPFASVLSHPVSHPHPHPHPHHSPYNPLSAISTILKYPTSNPYLQLYYETKLDSS